MRFVPPVPRWASFVVCLVVLLLWPSTPSAQQAPRPIADPNVNMVRGITLPTGDPFMQRQNEPSIAVSTRNPCHLVAGANDYRSVDIPFGALRRTVSAFPTRVWGAANHADRTGRDIIAQAGCQSSPPRLYAYHVVIAVVALLQKCETAVLESAAILCLFRAMN